MIFITSRQLTLWLNAHDSMLDTARLRQLKLTSQLCEAREAKGLGARRLDLLRSHSSGGRIRSKLVGA
jgi:hypothetical protein